MNTNEARLKIHGAITEVLLAMLAEDDAGPDELDEMEDAMGQLADIIMEDLGLEVTSVNEDGTINTTLQLYSDLVEADEEA